MPTFSDGESGASVRTKINTVIDKVDGVTAIDNDITITGDLTVDTNIAVGTAAGASGGDVNMVKPGASSAFLNLKGGAGRAKVVLGNDDAVVSSGTGTIQFRTGAGTTDTGTEVARVTSTGLGIGTTSPSTTLDVNGIVTADGLTVDGSSSLNGDITMNTGTPELRMYSSTSVNGYALLSNVSDTVDGGLSIKDVSGDVLANFKSNGDISFYEDTGTTPKFFWDASAESLGIGTTSPTEKLDLEGADGARVAFTDTGTRRWSVGNDGTSFTIKDESGATEAMRINSSGNVLIGTAINGGSKLRVVGLPTSSAGLSAGDIWNDGGTLKIV